MKDRVFWLMQQHRRIDDALRVESARRLPDPFRLFRLKRMKLAVKDHLAALTGGMTRRAPQS